ncbi:SDR family NAD(P)-dependent oxidoreductase [Lutibaculum baratangense]|uniref:3-oxoacyl-[acyl-carrier protein] reductase n=1 Tax=Lutibaculum baratangense AMV1 TaxID=631454 RepID=V4TBJ4_9HYPH|nr:glucose 1-dehydrogenase [Lutibaculum baratangense]ESR23768.1 3-oxoacyl-[acyl-carrier protein] reductase [Lutibaculum baratangense AMV1]
MNFEGEFRGKSVVVTGAAGLYGRRFAEAFAAEGAKVCLTDRDQGELEGLLGEMELPEGSFAHAADLTDDASMKALIDAVGERFGAADVVVNNAGIYPSGFLLDIDVADWDRIFDVNLRAPFVLSVGFAKQMIAKGVKGSIVNISSGASRKMRRTVVPYCTSKTALDRLTKGLAIELAEFGIRVNALEPGFGAGSTVSQLAEEHVKRVTAAVPLGRESKASDLGPAVLYLASSAAEYVTGATLTVDGGNSIGSLEVYQDKKHPL